MLLFIIRIYSNRKISSSGSMFPCIINEGRGEVINWFFKWIWCARKQSKSNKGCLVCKFVENLPSIKCISLYQVLLSLKQCGNSLVLLFILYFLYFFVFYLILCQLISLCHDKCIKIFCCFTKGCIKSNGTFDIRSTTYIFQMNGNHWILDRYIFYKYVQKQKVVSLNLNP